MKTSHADPATAQRIDPVTSNRTKLEPRRNKFTKPTWWNGAPVETTLATIIFGCEETSITPTLESILRSSTAPIQKRDEVGDSRQPAPQTHMQTCTATSTTTSISVHSSTAIPAQNTSTPQPASTPFATSALFEGLVLGLGLGLPVAFIIAWAWVWCPKMMLGSLPEGMTRKADKVTGEEEADDKKTEEVESVVVVPPTTYQKDPGKGKDEENGWWR